MTVFRWLVTFLLLLVASSAYGNQLDFEYLGQLPEFDVLAGEPVSYKFRNTNVDDFPGEGVSTVGMSTAIRISVDGQVKPPASGIFSSSFKLNSTIPDCVPDPIFPDWWACFDLNKTGDSQEYSFTWTPPGVGTYALEFRAICLGIPIPPTGPEYCDAVIRSVTTVVNPDTDGDGVGDPTDPDDDNDGIPDDLDEQPLVPSNVCSESGFDNATLGIAITADLTCAARASIDVLGATQVYGDGGHLRLIAPSIRFHPGFGVLDGGNDDGRLTVISANPCPDCGGYEIGDTGPAGGFVFYVTDGGWHGLEAAPEDQSTGAPWGCYGTLTSADGIAVGTGTQNTDTIIETGCAVTGDAARLAFDYSVNGFNDWFLPSKDELNLIYQNLHTHNSPLGGFASDHYWSSSEADHNFAQTVGFDGSLNLNPDKRNPGLVRAVRAF